MRRIIALFCATLMAVSMVGCKSVPGKKEKFLDANGKEVVIDYEEAEKDFRKQVADAGIPAFYGYLYSDSYRYDVTGDGIDDICICISFGSGMVRDCIVVYDPVADRTYMLDGYSISYHIEKCDENGLVVSSIGHNISEGTVVLKDDVLFFVPDKDFEFEAIRVHGLPAIYCEVTRASDYSLEYFKNIDETYTESQIIADVGEPNGSSGIGNQTEYWEVDEGFVVITFTNDDETIFSVRLCDSEGTLETYYSHNAKSSK